VALAAPLTLRGAPTDSVAVNRGRDSARNRDRASCVGLGFDRHANRGNEPTRRRFLLLLAGLEVDYERLRGRLLRLTAFGYTISFGFALLIGIGLHAGGLVKSPLLVGVLLSATSLGILIPVLKDTGQVATPFGQLVVAGASIAEIATIVLLSFFFSGEAGSIGASWFRSACSRCSCSRSPSPCSGPSTPCASQRPSCAPRTRQLRFVSAGRPLAHRLRRTRLAARPGGHQTAGY
jgi:sodium/hydrogen exchanger family protein